MKQKFLDIETGDIVVAFDEYTHDYNEHILKITSVEYDKEYATDSNPNGMVCFGDDLEEEQWGDDYITQVHEGNFVKFAPRGTHLWVCERCLMAIESREGNQAVLKHYVDDDETETKCDWCEEDGFDVLYELI